ncbi:hypothetical protein X769_07690 [Mesorhizobium sp. LSJC268A00]|nr:hypothetical protein X771_31795 [Mesorhizobium sp. LSJC277A00]ESW82282.1 hypothetical protein X773_12890 [Mesorhizobium sp. LSJC285A00]ESW93824.1 hypothetical protein X770_01030 [Mesorhizobium sp. LSJC269B00]ESX07231.1 hypothetical protein X769_07690 [Mesorhizobium sp. LSJC268A00]ESX10466.1 hypothetical protein X768_14325 [Mesorhizobium sp. LSJC265A00]ESX20961.1 hypothetical protein X766_04515 [Mesorhizobium sp. LSJC255A00]ESX27831.1 hypothetical protein X767_02665 [Mesorhizobium sp. LSJC2
MDAKSAVWLIIGVLVVLVVAFLTAMAFGLL